MYSSSFIYLLEREREIKVRFFEFCFLLNGWNLSHLNMIFHVQVFLVLTRLTMADLAIIVGFSSNQKVYKKAEFLVDLL